MRFAAVALFAGAALAAQKGGEGGDYTTVTDVETITSCAPTVTNCPGRSHSWAEETSTSAPETWPTPSTSSSATWAAPTHSGKGSGSWGNGTWPTTVSSVTKAAPTSSPASYPSGSWGSAGSWDDCECDQEDTCTSGSASPTGGSSGSGSGSSGYGHGSSNSSVSTSSPTGIVTAGASSVAPAFLAIAAGLVAFLA